jgi:hypothetical protein
VVTVPPARQSGLHAWRPCLVRWLLSTSYGAPGKHPMGIVDSIAVRLSHLENVKRIVRLERRKSALFQFGPSVRRSRTRGQVGSCDVGEKSEEFRPVRVSTPARQA